MMRTILILFLAILLFLIFLMMIKVIIEKKVFDRMNGVSVIGALVILVILIIGFLDGRPEMYIDIAIAYGMLGFVGNIIVAKYLFRHKKVRTDKGPSKQPADKKANPKKKRKGGGKNA